MSIVMDAPRKTQLNGREVLTAHLISTLTGAEGTAELLDFGKRIGLSPTWLQHRGTPKEHFDLIGGRCQTAMNAGAVVDRRLLAQKIGAKWDACTSEAVQAEEAEPVPASDERTLPEGAGQFRLTRAQQEVQDRLLHRLLDRSPGAAKTAVSVLTGPAGTGKTTLVKTIVAELKQRSFPVLLMAPTGKAAARLKQVVGDDTAARTIHGWLFKGAKNVGVCPICSAAVESLGLSVAEAIQLRMDSLVCTSCYVTFSVPDEARNIQRTLAFKDGAESLPARAVAIVDEASMVSKRFYGDMMAVIPPGWRVLFVGDREQLQPVVLNGEAAGWGVDFDNPHGVLTEVLRQAAGNPIIRHATRIRTGETGSNYWELEETHSLDSRLSVRTCRTWDDAVRLYIDHRLARRPDGSWDTDKQNVVLLTYVNSLRRHLNALIRQRLTLAAGISLSQASALLETPFVSGDRLLITANNTRAGVMNGEVFSVKSVTYPDAEAKRYGLARVEVWAEGDTTATFWLRVQTVGLSHNTHRQASFPLRRRLEDLDQELHRLLPVQDEHSAQSGTLIHPVLDTLPPEDLWRYARVVLPSSLIQCDYGDCISVVKSQGSQWKHVIIAWDRTSQYISGKDPDQGRRIAYTALTRAQETARVFVSREFAPKDTLKAEEREIADYPERAPAWMSDSLPEIDVALAARALLAQWKLRQEPEESEESEESEDRENTQYQVWESE